MHINIQETPIRPYAFVWQDLGLHHVWQNGDRDKEKENEQGEEEGWEEKEKNFYSHVVWLVGKSEKKWFILWISF